MIKRIKAGWELTRKSGIVLKENRSLMVFPILALITSIIFVILVFSPFVGYLVANADNQISSNSLEYAIIALCVISAYLTAIATIFFNVALSAAAIEAFEDRPASVKIGVAKAWQRKKQIVGWAFVTTTVGLLLRLIAEKVPGGALLEVIGGFAWAVASWFVIPSLAVEGKGPWQSLKSSARTVKERWGQGVVGVVAIGGAFVLACMLVFIVCFLIIMLAASADLPTASLVAIGIVGFIAVLILGLIAGTLKQVFNTAVFLSIKDNNRQVGPFTPEDIEKAAIFKRGHQQNTI
jgi:hypothetical protein